MTIQEIIGLVLIGLNAVISILTKLQVSKLEKSIKWYPAGRGNQSDGIICWKKAKMLLTRLLY